MEHLAGQRKLALAQALFADKTIQPAFMTKEASQREELNDLGCIVENGSEAEAQKTKSLYFFRVALLMLLGAAVWAMIFSVN